MAAKRAPSQEERDLFETALQDSVPLKKAPRRARKTVAVCKPETPPAPPKTAERTRAVRRPAGIDGNTADRLRRGRLEPQARLDLHGLTERAAHRALVIFVRAAAARKHRLVLVVTGKGDDARAAGKDPLDKGLHTGRRGVLRSMTPRWLREPGLSELIADSREAHRRHGGAGALYVYLRKG
jgi:DNA-nicking Smr family endonuclease